MWSKWSCAQSQLLSITKVAFLMASKLSFNLSQSYHASTSPSHVQRLSTSWILPPWALFGLRVAISLYAFVVELTSLGYQATHGDTENARQSFSYFTNLSYWGLAFYFAFAAAHTGSYASRGKAWLESWPGWFKWLHSALYMTVTVCPVIVTGAL